jgi:hypothetical protein
MPQQHASPECRELTPEPTQRVPPGYEGLVADGDFDAVHEAVRELAPAIRTRLSHRTGLKLLSGKLGVSVSLNAAVPDPFDRLVQLLGSELLRFRMQRPVLVRGLEANHRIRDFLGSHCEVARHVALTEQEQRVLEDWDTLLRRLHREASAIRFKDAFSRIDEDVLGSYRPANCELQVYWIPLAIFAAANGVGIRETTAVVLTHELAHAFTHAGRDVDDKAWETRAFLGSERAAVEGLAQFYTQLVCREMRRPQHTEGDSDALSVFELLLDHQSAVYRAHVPWLEQPSKVVGEAVRFALLEERRTGTACTHDSLSTRIAANVQRLR